MPVEFPKGSITMDFAKGVTPGTLAEDVEGDAVYTEEMDDSNTFFTKEKLLAAGLRLSLASKDLTFDANSLAFAAAFACLEAGSTNKLELYMGGLLMQTMDVLSNDDSLNHVLRDFKALSGIQTCELKWYNSAGTAGHIDFYGYSISSECPAAIAVGSIKLG